ncbi:hypothetical protein HK104_008618 [Borealophlyctis nickersoniae]|nr:hypothetical protein HK104_008618 [Borealophlyctis nickersoniae]
MDARALALFQENNVQELKELLLSATLDDLVQVLTAHLARDLPNHDPVKLLRAFYLGLSDRSPQGIERRSRILVKILEWLRTCADGSHSTARLATDVVNCVLSEIDILPAKDVLSCTELIVDVVRNGETPNVKLFEFLPKFLELLAKLDTLSVSDKQTMSGQEKRDLVLDKLCSLKWEPQMVFIVNILACVGHAKGNPDIGSNSKVGKAVSIVSAIREVPSSMKQLEHVINRTIRQLDTVDLHETPSLVYQILLLSKKGARRLVLQGISSHFSRLHAQSVLDVDDDAKNLATLARTEGTIILHITFAIKQDQELGQELLKWMKTGDTHTMTPFTVSLLLAMARIHRFQEPALDFLKSAVVTCIKDALRLQKSPWIMEHSELSPTPINEIMMDIVQMSVYGWEQVIQGLVEHALALLDLAAAGIGGMNLNGAGNFWNPGFWVFLLNEMREAAKSTALSTPQEIAAKLGSTVLLETFRNHEIVRVSMLDEIFSRIISQTKGIAYVLGLFEKIVAECPQALFGHVQRIKEFLESLPNLNSKVAHKLLQAVYPLVDLNPSFRDGLMLTLRKGLFSKELGSRRVALHGFLEILMKMPVSDEEAIAASSQSFGPSFASQRPEHKALTYEIISNLRRCFGQQYEMRAQLYEGFIRLLDSHPDLSPALFEIIFQHFLQYYEADAGINAPLRLEATSPTVAELHLSDYGDTQTAAAVEFRAGNTHMLLSFAESFPQQLDSAGKTLSDLLQRLAKADMEDFELDKSAEYGGGRYLRRFFAVPGNQQTESFVTTCSVGMRNNMLATLLLGSYEAMLEYAFFTGRYTPQSCELVLKLFKRYADLHALVKEKAGGAKGRKTASADASILQLDCGSAVIAFLFGADAAHQEQGRMLLRNEAAFVKYVITGTQAQLTKLAADSSLHMETTFDQLSNLASVLFHEFLASRHNELNPNSQAAAAAAPAANAKKEKGKGVFTSAIECLELTIRIIHDHYSSRFVSFLRENVLGDAEGVEDMKDTEVVERVVKILQRLVVAFISDRIPLHKESTLLTQTISLLSKHFDPAQIDRLRKWAERFCTDQNVEDAGVAKAVVGVLVASDTKVLEFVVKLQFAEDFHAVFGPVQPENEDEELGEVQLKIVNEKTAPAIALLLFSNMEHMLDDLDWCLGKLKKLPKDESQDTQRSTQRASFENHICHILGSIVTILSQVEESRIPETVSEPLLKTLSKAYKVLTALTKYKLTTPKSIHKNYIAVVEFASIMTKHMYQLIPYLQQRQSEVAMEKAHKKKSSKKGGAAGGGSVKIVKEGRTIPNLVYLVEQFDRYLIQLNKKCHVNLMKFVRRSTARDFKIHSNQIVIESSEEEEEDPKKRRRTETPEVGGGENERPAEGGEDEEEEEEEEEHTTSKDLTPLRLLSGAWYDRLLGDTPVAINTRVGYKPLSLFQSDINITSTLQMPTQFIEQVQATNTDTILFLTVFPIDGWDVITDDATQQMVKVIGDLTKGGRRVLLRYASEMNGYWFKYGQQPTKFLANWRKVIPMIRNASNRDNLAIIWGPNSGENYPWNADRILPGTDDFRILDTNSNGRIDTSDDPYSPYYPGDDLVDWVGMSLYWYGPIWPWVNNTRPTADKVAQHMLGHYPNGTRYPSVYSMFSGDGSPGPGVTLNKAPVSKGGKPFLLTETGSTYHLTVHDTATGRMERTLNGDGRVAVKQAWWRQFFNQTFLHTFPKFKAVSFFEFQKFEETTTRDFTNLGVYSGTKDPLTGQTVEDDNAVLKAFKEDVKGYEFIVWANATKGTGATNGGQGGQNSGTQTNAGAKAWETGAGAMVVGAVMAGAVLAGV